MNTEEPSVDAHAANDDESGVLLCICETGKEKV